MATSLPLQSAGSQGSGADHRSDRWAQSQDRGAKLRHGVAGSDAGSCVQDSPVSAGRSDLMMANIHGPAAAAEIIKAYDRLSVDETTPWPREWAEWDRH